jgi:hypothetical protein
MKNIRNIINNKMLLALTVAVSFTSCDKNFKEINTDPIGIPVSSPNQLLAPALVNVLTANMRQNRDFNNELMQVTVVPDANGEGQVFRYDIRRSWADRTWNSAYIELTNLSDIGTIAKTPEYLNKSYQAISLITQSWVYSILTDVYGDVPYTEASRGREGIIEPKFDKQKDIYLSLFSKLEEANSLLTANEAITATGDPVFKGEVDKWRRFGNSLYLRLLLRIAHKTEVSANVIAKMKEIVDTNPTKYPIMTDNTHTAKILWNGTNSSSAVYSSPFMIHVRAADFRGLAITSYWLDRLVAWGDPRMNVSLGKASTPRWGVAQGPNGLVGIPTGYSPGTGVPKQAYFFSDTQAIGGYVLQTDPYTGILMNVAEVDFILAEAAAKGYINGTGEAYYYKGISDAVNYWLPNYAFKPTDANFTKFITNADLDWDNALPVDDQTRGSASKMELIHVQKYYANFLVDYQEWIEYRRTGHPFLSTGPGFLNGGKMPSRLNYPLITQAANPSNYAAAVASQGADDINTKVWWQKP